MWTPQNIPSKHLLRRYDWKIRDAEAVHYAPHGYLDVKNIACDFLACSPYKFFGPHSGLVGHLWGMDGTLGPGFQNHLLSFFRFSGT